MKQRLVATYSIVARDPRNGDLGVAVQSKFLAVGSIVPWVRAEVGAVATQARANVEYGPAGLALLEQGVPAPDAVRRMVENDSEREHRQVGVVDREGRAAVYTGNSCFAWAGHIIGDGFSCQGNILTGEGVINRMAAAFEAAEGELAERMVAALAAGEAAGGDRRGRQSAALYVARVGGAYGGVHDRYIDLRVDDHSDPIEELQRLLRLHRFYLTKPSEKDLIPIDAAIAGELQDALRDLGYYTGPNTDTYDHLTREALFAYGGVENLEQRLVEDARIDRQVLEFIRQKHEQAQSRQKK